MKSILKSQAGFTLIELLTTLAILLIVLVPLGSYFVVSTTNNVRADLQHRANLVAERYMEQWKNSGEVIAEELPPNTGKISTGDAQAGTDLTIIQTAEIVSNAIVGEPEPAVPVAAINPDVADGLKPLDPPNPIPAAVKSAIENYQVSTGSPSDITATYRIDATGVSTNGAHEDVAFSTVDISAKVDTNNVNLVVLTVSFNGLTKVTSISSGTANLIFEVASNDDRTIKVSNSCIPMKIYLIHTDAAIDDGHIVFETGQKNVSLYRNILSQAAASDVNRVYKVTVKVVRTDDQSGPALATLMSYMHTK